MSKKLLNLKPFQETLNAGYCGPTSLKIMFAIRKIQLADLSKCAKLLKNLTVNRHTMFKNFD